MYPSKCIILLTLRVFLTSPMKNDLELPFCAENKEESIQLCDVIVHSPDIPMITIEFTRVLLVS